MHIEKLQVDLDDAKEKLNYQLPDPNFWINFALDSHGKIYRFDCFQLKFKGPDFCFDVHLAVFLFYVQEPKCTQNGPPTPMRGLGE